MILLTSNAQHLYWLGRYLTRIRFFCQQYPFTEQSAAKRFTDSFGLPTQNVVDLNFALLDPQQSYSLVAQLSSIKDNIDELRGVLATETYAKLNRFLRAMNQQSSEICSLIEDCYPILQENLTQDGVLFLQLGQLIELLDIGLRFNQDIAPIITQMQQQEETLSIYAWYNPIAWQQFKTQPNLTALYQFHHEFLQAIGGD
ncbi:alpha-E domain-containing protein [Lonepinella koalarum]|uniref:Uncharacterized protein with alpha-helical domain and ER motif n=1 Tax=Lonepinella koalarum TaxID=53417 RepID=A0A4R1KWH0_9PAST|nr:alpha-E domain-containing protein [Lonepinella koalarum]MDH2926461.1 hypothetical protein [Lonepinella koalarum]TCK69602.1 uncharacterized protein with alpha-helical domain and ER motif [Lonepinella koalarum]TFJ89844.1 hypothetical protein E0709_06900 [Lonepinella koalarum]TYG34118.1 alpha-E domain-containing protein [Lonepinella koalarum]